MNKPRTDSLTGNTANYSEKELGLLDEYMDLVTRHQALPEILLYNFARVARTQDVTKFLVFHDTFREILGVPGVVAEIGVLEGQSLFAMAHFSEIYEHRNYVRKIVGFDTFDGYTLPNGKRIEPADPALLDASVDLFNRAIQFNQFEKITLVKGPPEDTVPAFFQSGTGEVCGLLILHSGLYEVERTALEAVWPRMPVGGVVLMGGFASDETPQCTDVVADVIGIGNLEMHRFPFATKYCYFKKTTPHMEA